MQKEKRKRKHVTTMQRLTAKYLSAKKVMQSGRAGIFLSDLAHYVGESNELTRNVCAELIDERHIIICIEDNRMKYYPRECMGRADPLALLRPQIESVKGFYG